MATQTIDDIMEEKLQVDISDLWLPESTGSYNPIIKRVDGSKAAYLIYAALAGYTNGIERRVYIYPASIETEAIKSLRLGYYEAVERSERCQYLDFNYRFMDEVTRIFRHGLSSSGKKHRTQVEVEDRKSFLKHPYIIAVKDGKVFGGIWFEDYHFLTHHRKTGQRIRNFHISVIGSKRGSGMGSELLDVAEAYIRGKKEDGMRCYFDDDEAHKGTEKFLEKGGYEIKKSESPPAVEAIKVFN